jgi:3-phytase
MIEKRKTYGHAQFPSNESSRTRLYSFILTLVCVSSLAGGIFAATSVRPVVETDPSPHSGDTADDSAIWIHPTDPSLSLIIGDDKEGGLMVWGLDGRQLQYVNGTLYNNVDLRYHVPLAGSFSDGTTHERVDLVGVGDEENSEIDFFKVNPATRSLEPAGSVPTQNLIPYGSCMYHSPLSGKYYYFVNAKSGVVQQFDLSGASGTMTGQMVRTFGVGTQTEGCVADDELGSLYIGEESVGIWKYGAEPGAGATRTQVDAAGSGRLVADVEGLTIYYHSDGTGYLIASSQGDSTFAVYTREGSNAYLGSFQVDANGGIDEVSGSDGLDITNFPLGSAFPNGLVVVHDDSNSGASASNHKFVQWESVANALSLRVDTSWDPRQIGADNPPPPPPPGNRHPTANPDSATTTSGSSVTIAVLANDTDPSS